MSLSPSFQGCPQCHRASSSWLHHHLARNSQGTCSGFPPFTDPPTVFGDLLLCGTFIVEIVFCSLFSYLFLVFSYLFSLPFLVFSGWGFQTSLPTDCALSAAVVAITTTNYIVSFGRSSAYSSLSSFAQLFFVVSFFPLFFILHVDTTAVLVSHLQPKCRMLFSPSKHLTMCLPLDKCVFMCFCEERT